MKKNMFFCLLVAGYCRADDITLNDGTVYKDARVISHSVTSATIETQTGGAIVPMEKLPPDLQKKYGFDPAAAKEASKERETERAKATADLEDQTYYEAALKKYALVGGKLVAAGATGPTELNVKLLQSGDVTMADGRVIPNGCAVTLYAQNYVTVSASPDSAPKAVAVGINDTGSVAVLTWSLNTDEVTTVKASKVGVSNLGYPVYAPIGAFTIEQWRAAGRPQ